LTGAELVVEAADRDTQPLNGLAIEVALERPLGESAVRRMELRPAGAGRYAARLEPLPKGQWEARIAASSGDDRMFATQRLTAP
jgi:nitrogen fixation protein FixH